ncbi:hypothetical protein GOODEAATRI_003971 [Goodea atripinnis]|uniref:Uncharacterized protein n=1 Tax=Goodea atripinnis TaxID=208336 RepID=A0ABV0PB61_9TELE
MKEKHFSGFLLPRRKSQGIRKHEKNKKTNKKSRLSLSENHSSLTDSESTNLGHKRSEPRVLQQMVWPKHRVLLSDSWTWCGITWTERPQQDGVNPQNRGGDLWNSQPAKQIHTRDNLNFMHFKSKLQTFFLQIV